MTLPSITSANWSRWTNGNHKMAVRLVHAGHLAAVRAMD